MSRMLLRNARVSGSSGEPVDIVITDGVIDHLGDARTAAAESTDLDSTDLEGRWVSPGLWDNHVHFSQWALRSRRLDVSAGASARHTARLVGEALSASMEPPVPFVAVGFRDGLWPDEPSLEILDATTGPSPVVIVSADLHSTWLNSAALALYGHKGHATGLLREDDAFELTRRINTIAEDVLDGWADDAARAAAARGVVGIVDLEMDGNLETWTRRMARGTDSLRVEFGIYAQHLERAIERGLRSGQQVTPLLTVGGFKILSDGSLNTRTAYCYDEYPGLEGSTDSRGMLTVPTSELLPLLARAASAGIVPFVHAIGDHANTVALDAFDELGVGGRIEHAQLVADADLGRFGALGVIASVQPDHAMDDRDVAEHYWAGRTGRAFPLRALLDAGATLALGSDAPVSALDPWATAAAAVGRARDGREPWHPEQRISAEEALTASTRTRVAVGEPADLIVTETDPRAADAEGLRNMDVAATLLGGRYTFSAL